MDYAYCFGLCIMYGLRKTTFLNIRIIDKLRKFAKKSGDGKLRRKFFIRGKSIIYHYAFLLHLMPKFLNEKNDRNQKEKNQNTYQYASGRK